MVHFWHRVKLKKFFISTDFDVPVIADFDAALLMQRFGSNITMEDLRLQLRKTPRNPRNPPPPHPDAVPEPSSIPRDLPPLLQLVPPQDTDADNESNHPPPSLGIGIAAESVPAYSHKQSKAAVTYDAIVVSDGTLKYVGLAGPFCGGNTDLSIYHGLHDEEDKASLQEGLSLEDKLSIGKLAVGDRTYDSGRS